MAFWIVQISFAPTVVLIIAIAAMVVPMAPLISMLAPLWLSVIVRAVKSLVS